MTHLQTLHAALRERRLVKVIAGIENFDKASVMAIAKAAAQGGAQAVDIAADAELVRAVKAETHLIVFVSSVEPAKLIAAAEAGADVLELGNYDALYHQGIHPTKEQILGWAREVKNTVGNRVPLCVTVSGHLSLAEQLDLATTLQAMGVDILQTEGQVGPQGNDTFSALSGAVSALANTAEIRKVVELPLLLAGGFNVVSAPFAIAAGADALGVGKAVTSLKDEAAMAAATAEIVKALDSVHTAGKGLVRA
jgi:thiamine monophosphate synthase